MQKVRILKDFEKYKKGKVYCVSNNEAASLIQEDVALLAGFTVTTEMKPKPKRRYTRRKRSYKTK